MADKENRRKCFKCGCSPIIDGVKLFRFPKPSIRNLVRCELWAKFMFPEGNYSSTEFQAKLHNEHRMLCQIHFLDDEFTDDSKQKLLRSAVPANTSVVSTVLQHAPACVDAVAGPSQVVEQPYKQRIPCQKHVLNAEFMDDSKKELLKSTVQANISLTPCVLPQYEPACVDPQPGPSGLKEKPDWKKNEILMSKCQSYLRKICNLKNIIRRLKSKDILRTLDEDMAVRKLSSKLTPSFALLLQGQLRNCKKKNSGKRWSKDEKITALRIYKRSPTCYRLLRRLFNLPSQTTLKNLLNQVPFNVGVHTQVFDSIVKLSKKQTKIEEYTLMFDEMAIKKHIQYDIRSDTIKGYQDHGSQGRSPAFAVYALVFMLAGIRHNYKQPIAHYFSSGSSTADRLAVLVKEVLLHCFEAGIKIASIVCDMDGVNRRTLHILGASIQQPWFIFQGHAIVTIFDTPHLLKCFRNLFMKYDIECTVDISAENRVGKGVAKWSHIKKFHEIDSSNPNFVYAHTLKKQHLEPNTKQKMKVNLAAEVLSNTVSGGMYSLIAQGKLTAEATITANMISKIDKLFDLLNSNSNDLRRGKPFSTNIKSNSPHIKTFQEMKLFFTNLKYIGSNRKPPSQDGWIWTMNAVERLWKNLVEKYKIKSLATRRLQQDPLENLFGCIRGNCGSNTNPTCSQFEGGLKTAILSKLAHVGTGNCENDNNEIITNIKIWLTKKPAQTTDICAEQEIESSIQNNEITEEFNENDSEIQACAYVCGFIIRKIKEKVECDDCTKILCSSAGRLHTFVEFREYSDNNQSLTYSSKDMVKCVESSANLLNQYFKEHGYKNNIKKRVCEKLKTKIDFDFIKNCELHKDHNIKIIIESVFAICIKRYCILQNRKFNEEASALSLKRKINILSHR